MFPKRQVLVQARRYATVSDHYQTLELPRTSSIKDIKLQFKRLSKKYHPDLNPNLSPEQKEEQKEKFMEIVNAYDVLKHKEKKRQYDMQLGVTRGPSRTSNNSYGNAKYYSKSGASYSASGLNTTRHRVRFNEGAPQGDDSGKFSGRHINYGDRYDVPHFNYSEHLHKHLKFEQRILGKHISQEDKEKIIGQLHKSGLKVLEELITKHLMRQIDPLTGARSTHVPKAPENSHRAYMYQAPDNDSSVFRNFAILSGAVTLVYLIYLIVH